MVWSISARHCSAAQSISATLSMDKPDGVVKHALHCSTTSEVHSPRSDVSHALMRSNCHAGASLHLGAGKGKSAAEGQSESWGWRGVYVCVCV